MLPDEMDRFIHEQLERMVAEVATSLGDARIGAIVVLPCRGINNFSGPVEMRFYGGLSKEEALAPARAGAAYDREKWENMPIHGLKGMRVVSRRQGELAAVEQELDLAAVGIIDNSTAAKYGRLVGAKAVIVPELDQTFQRMDGAGGVFLTKFSVFKVRVLEVQTGQLLYTGLASTQPYSRSRALTEYEGKVYNW